MWYSVLKVSCKRRIILTKRTPVKGQDRPKVKIDPDQDRPVKIVPHGFSSPRNPISKHAGQRISRAASLLASTAFPSPQRFIQMSREAH